MEVHIQKYLNYISFLADSNMFRHSYQLLDSFCYQVCLLDQVMEQCVSRLDVAMFNDILRELAHEIPTDPVSNPIANSKALSIPAGYLSFGSGAQLKIM